MDTEKKFKHILRKEKIKKRIKNLKSPLQKSREMLNRRESKIHLNRSLVKKQSNLLIEIKDTYESQRNIDLEDIFNKEKSKLSSLNTLKSNRVSSTKAN